MKHAIQIEIIEQLLAMLDTGTTCDAGSQVSNPTGVYVDPELARQEWAVFFREHPQLVGLSADLGTPGSYLCIDDLGVPILATRDPEGTFRAFINACRHRGTRLCDAPRGVAKRFVCPFHGWTYNPDGALVGITEATQFGALDATRFALLELPAAEHHGMLWVHPQPDATLEPQTLLGDLDEEFETWNLGSLKYRAGRRMDMRMNWKLANDTFGETYHFKRLHRNTLSELFIGDVLAYETFDRNHRAVFPSQKIAAIKNKAKENWRIDHVSTVLYFLFPNIQMTVSDRQVTLFRIYPHLDDPQRSITQVSHYFSEEALALIESGTKTVIGANNVYDKNARDGNAIISPDAAMEVLNSTLENEDFRMAESTQRNAAAGVLDHIVFGRNEAPLHHFHNTYRDALGMPPLQPFDSSR